LGEEKLVVNISFTPTALASHPVISTAPANAFALQLGPISNVLIPRPINASSADPIRNGSAFQINLRPGETFLIEDADFEVLVSNARNGGDVSFLTRLLDLIYENVLQVQQDNGAPLTPKQVLNYTAP
jgi:hypothetical protein